MNIAAKEIPVLRVAFGLMDQNQEKIDQPIRIIKAYKTRPIFH